MQLYPPTGHTLPHLYGWVTDSATQVVEAANPGRRRSYAMMTTATGATTGSPSEWSATIDRLSFGSAGTLKREEEQVKRLFILSAGNVSPKLWASYPTINTTTTIESPAQAWNALTVGAHTEMTEIDAGKWPSLKCIAAEGALSPSSSTSMLWSRGWPFKPDVVAEGGNGSTDKFGAVVGPGSLRLLTTYHDMTVSPLVETGDTSAAAAEVARLCAHLTTRYPDYWPETIRALVIHGARYTPAMLQSLAKNPSGNDKEGLVRRVGYGAIRADNALNSTTHRPTLILQEKIVPYRKEGSDGRLNKVNMHRLPWPADELLALGGAELQMRVTLSYFIDPNPSQRGWQSKFRYQSHGLRFSVKAATETDEEFGQRINKIEREEAADGDELESMPDPDSGKWLLGSRIRSRGSVHSDVWNGTAAELANKSHLAVFPVGGWWKDWSQAERHGVEVRYCLIVSLEVSEEIAVDLYTPIQTQIVVPATPAVVDISIPTS
ncbi:S8 family peptidase [Pseudoxanthomonas mexicana]